MKTLNIPFIGEPAKITLCTYPSMFALPVDDSSSEAKLTINAKGQLNFTTTEYYRPVEPIMSYGKWFKRTLTAEEAKGILLAVANPFRAPQESVAVCDGDEWKLTIENTEGTVFKYSGFVYDRCFEGANEISDLLRKAVAPMDFLAFDGNLTSES